HNLPEARPGPNLSEDEARQIALAALGEAQARAERERDSAKPQGKPAAPTNDGSGLKEISADASKKPARTDWTFVFKDTHDYGLPEGEPRVSIEIGGDQVVDLARFIYVPEDWLRNERKQQNIHGILRTICTDLLVGLVLGASIVGIVHWSRH